MGHSGGRLGVAALMAAVCITAAACNVGSVSPAGSAPKHTASSSATAFAAEKIGEGFKVTNTSGDVYRVYLTKVIDPARGANSFVTPDNGKRFVGVVFTIVGVNGSSTDNANNDATVIGSNGQTYTADFNAIAGYTNFNNGEFNIAPRMKSVGAVTFQIPDQVKVSEVQWSATSGFGGQPGTWHVE